MSDYMQPDEVGPRIVAALERIAAALERLEADQ